MINFPNKKRDPNIAAKQQVERELAQVEQEYKAGISTVRDLIAPAALQTNPNYLIVSGKYCRTYYTLAYPRFLSVNWHAPLMGLDTPIDLSLFIYPEDPGKILKKLRNKAAQVESQMMINQEKGLVRDPMLETAMNDIEELRNKLQQGLERHFQTGLYLTIYADSFEYLIIIMPF